MLDWKYISEFWPKQPADNRLYIFVMLPATTDAPDRHRDKRRRESPCTPPDVLDLRKTNRLTTKLPLVQELRALLEKPLADSEKVPIQQEKYDALFSDLRPDVCSRRDLDTLFTIGVEVPVLAIIFTAVSGPPPSSGTECAFVSFWDANIRGIVELLIPEGTSIRNSNRHTETRNLRPDFDLGSFWAQLARLEAKRRDLKTWLTLGRNWSTSSRLTSSAGFISLLLSCLATIAAHLK
ncbi:hypothetical protein AX14_006561 [Amanita brunnescens Koide BX004]|nr:hypothetical protein AX14_006561 [Amanita brunnescens Koide BX004]